MAPNRFRRDQREKREVTPFTDDKVVPEIPPEWRDLEAPINFTWVVQDELAGMGWPKSRDQLRFLISQGIDHLVTLSSDKLPPHYAFPELKWTLIPVEDFTGPTISEIKKFISIIDEARRNGEGVGVHCAEGRGRTGVMCACYLIYYHDIAPWDAIRIMRRQRPGSVERKVQEETVVKFFTLLNDFGRNSLDDLEVKEKELKEMVQKRQLQALQYDANLLLLHTNQFFGPQQNSSEHKAKRLEKFERMRRAKSMPKMDGEEELQLQEEAGAFQNHVQSFFTADQRSRSQPRPEKPERRNEADDDRRSRAVTPGRSLLGEISNNLKPVKPRSSVVAPETSTKACDFTKHFKDFMTTPASVKVLKRHRSFSNTRGDKDSNKEEVAKSSEEEEKGMGDSTESEKEVRQDQNKKKSCKEEEPVSRSSSPEQSGLSGSEKESGSEEATSSLSSQQTVETDNRRTRIPSTSNSTTASSHQNNHLPDLETTNSMSTKTTLLTRYSRKSSSTDYDSTTQQNASSKYSSRKSSNEILHDITTQHSYSRKSSGSDFNSNAASHHSNGSQKEVEAKSGNPKKSCDESSFDYSLPRYSRRTSSNDYDLTQQNHHQDLESKYSQNRKSSNDHEYALPRYMRKNSSSIDHDTSSIRKNSTENDNGVTMRNGHHDLEYVVPSKDYRRHSAPGGNPESHDESSHDQNPQPPPPAYKPKYTADTSTTYSYYTRIRSRAEETRRREAEAEKNVTTTGSVTPASNSVTMSPVTNARTFNARRSRAATIERDMQVTVTVTENPVTTPESNVTSWRTRIYGEASREIASYYPVRRRRPQSPETAPTTPKTATTSTTTAMASPQESQTASTRTSRSHYRRTNSGPLPELNNNDSACQSNQKTSEMCQRRTSADCGSSLNGYRESLLGSVTSDHRSVTSTRRSLGDTSSPDKNHQSGDNHYQMNGLRTRERAKSEGKALYDDDDDEEESGAGGGASAGKENHFLNAARKWASYEKPINYSSTITREGWKRTHRKFNYSRFLNYTKETYV